MTDVLFKDDAGCEPDWENEYFRLGYIRGLEKALTIVNEWRIDSGNPPPIFEIWEEISKAAGEKE